MTAFTASNGWTVAEELRCLKLARPNHFLRFISLDITEALREYFQHKRDQELGRWRDPENPDMVVYPDPRPDWVLVLDETSGDTDTVFRQVRRGPYEDDDFTVTADRYFDAHPEPEPKPWENAKPGEVWALTVAGQDQVYRCGQNGLYGLANGQPLRALTGMFVTGGRRIWPEQEDGE